MKALFRDALVYNMGKMSRANMLFDGTSLSVFEGEVSRLDDLSVFDNTVILPGFCDVHVHFREPGFSYKETIATGSRASARGGYTCVCTMPNLSPAPDSVENLALQLKLIDESACIKVIPYGTITVGESGEELSDLAGMADKVAGFSDDGRGVQSEDMMLLAMKEAARLNKPIVAHCEDNSLLRGGYIHDGEYARAHGHRGICSESEWGPIKRDIELVKKSGVSYHVCHISTKESVELIRRAKAEGVDITCETGPHYILLDDGWLKEDGRFKMNPPLRSREDRAEILRGIIDGTIDMIATDHAPHSAEEKSRGLEKSAMGVVGIETCFPLVYTYLVKTGIITMERAVELLSENPRARFGIEGDRGFTVFKLGESKKIDPAEFLSKGKSTPFEGMSTEAECLLTVYGGRAVYSKLN
ncbi:MAG: dihydroorotase [Clostridia bacterium]|nr:dihydroorotase [Clostridia bacterium]